MLPDADKSKTATCTRCKREIDIRLFRYLYVRAGWRGSRKVGQREYSGQPIPSSSVQPEIEETLCGPCGEDFRREFELFLLGAGLWQRGVVRD